MYQGTTPTIPIRFKNVNITAAKIYLSIFDDQKKELYNFVSGTDFFPTASGRDTYAELTLTQEQTLALGTGTVSIQGRWILPDGSAGATRKTSIPVNSILMKGVIEYDA
jgi:hypothetical protein